MRQLSDVELQGTLRRFCEEAIRLYAEGSGSSAPERVIQVHCALELIKLGFVVTIEPTGKQCQHWFGVREQSALRIDLAICEPSEDGNLAKAKPRALVEFKMNPWNLDIELERVARIVKETGVTFGYCLGCWCDSRPAAAQSAINYVTKRHQCAEAQFSNIPLGNGEQLYAAVVGMPVKAKGEKEPSAPVEEQPQIVRN
jgi:hypothetical protein